MRTFTFLGLFITLNASFRTISHKQRQVDGGARRGGGAAAAGGGAGGIVFLFHHLMGVAHTRGDKPQLLGSLTISPRTCIPRPATLQVGFRCVTQ